MLQIEIVCDTKVKIPLVEEEETWDNLDEPIKQNKDEQVEPTIDKINTNYLNKNIKQQ